MALTADGRVVCWGWNGNGQSRVPQLDSIALEMAPAGSITAIRGADRTLDFLGGDVSGSAATAVPPGIAVRSVAAGSGHYVAILADGAVTCWGSNSAQQCAVPAAVGIAESVSAGSLHSAAIRQDGLVFCWGSNGSGQTTPPPNLGPVAELKCGGSYTMARRSDGSVSVWGASTLTPPLGIRDAVQVAAGDSHALTLRADGTVSCWGLNNSGQCDAPANLGDVRAIAGGSDVSLALRKDGTIASWGNRDFGRGEFLDSIRTATQIAARGSSVIVRLDTDCNADGVLDATEPGFHDCNENGLHDACEAAVDAIEDCNDNGLGDTCEKQLTVALSSGHVGPIGYSSPAVWTIPGAVLASEPVRLRARAFGDFSGQLESVTIKVGSFVAGQAFAGSIDCSTTPWVYFTLPDAFFNAAIDAEGAVTIRADATIAVDALGCAGGTWIEFELDYTGASSSDCNANGLLDSCEIDAGWAVDANGNGVIDICESAFQSCPADFDQNGSVDAADLSQLLNAWGPAPGLPGLDLDANGSIDAADLAALLNAWGGCAR
jgi:alpha-tubulin suppressor-like RCC1 family protein